jgi:lipid II:glycine glycyltransferase (peptidoglycan interpeptide bridge formation enzyme)
MEPGVEADEGAARELVLAGWRRAPTVQPTQSRIIDLTIGGPLLWSGMRSKWRQYVRRAMLDGVEVTAGGRDDLPAFFDIIVETSARTGMHHRSLEAYRAIWDAFAPGTSTRLLLASEQGEHTAALLLIRCGDVEVELYGGMTERGARSRANYLLKWEAIRQSAASGVRRYDVWGLPNAGIAHFKAGFGGRIVSYTGAWDLATDRVGRPVLRLAEGLRTLWRRGMPARRLSA